MLATAVSVLAIEAAGRIAGFDFAFQRRAIAARPIFYTQPRVPVGPVFFRRDGPASWTGQVVRTAMRLDGWDDDAWEDEPVITVAYDELGFRNPAGQRDWAVVVAGDSFVELGHLPDEDIMTTRLGRRLGVPVRNLGVSYGGPLAALHHLDAYGRAPSLRHAVLVFYEGNDVEDLDRESAALAAVAAGAPRPRRDIVPQTSFVRALGEAIGAAWAWAARWRIEHAPRLKRNAFFAGAHGPVPVSVSGAGRVPTRRQRDRLDEALGSFAAWASRAGVTPWLLYVPAKARALAPRLTDLDGRPLQEPGPGPRDAVGRLAGKHGIGFVDTTPALREESSAGRLTYSGVYDTHVDDHGSDVMAEVLAGAIGSPPRP